ncbi:MAG: hypothetical protein EZS28_024480 [Streblomastix strix]|uniref:Uncharacterized protein n=1 Tax=Streblomastix strix TaxID=222440 RepID=A0A5J4VC24_9EUKA|nr:MAG: hypothetical protein EZS28_024480 [Streblomastix strix]
MEISGDYKLDPDVLRKACTTLGIWPTIDGFATRTNKQRRRYCSWLSDRNAVKQDCFNMNWSLECFLLHPPIKMILRTLSKIQRDQATASGEGGRYSDSRGSDERELAEASTRESNCHKDDRHWTGEVLLRRMLVRTGLTEQSVEVVIIAMSAETWRKRRAGVHLLKKYMIEKNLSLDDIKEAHPDVTMVNMLTWRNEKGGARCVADMLKIKTHVGVALGMFHNSQDVAKSGIVVAAVKELELSQRSQAKYNRTWNLDLFLMHIGKQG